MDDGPDETKPSRGHSGPVLKDPAGGTAVPCPSDRSHSPTFRVSEPAAVRTSRIPRRAESQRRSEITGNIACMTETSEAPPGNAGANGEGTGRGARWLLVPLALVPLALTWWWALAILWVPLTRDRGQLIALATGLPLIVVPAAAAYWWALRARRRGWGRGEQVRSFILAAGTATCLVVPVMLVVASRIP